MSIPTYALTVVATSLALNVALIWEIVGPHFEQPSQLAGVPAGIDRVSRPPVRRDDPPASAARVLDLWPRTASAHIEWDFYKMTEPGVTPKSSGPICAATSDWAATVAYRHDPGFTGLGTGGGSPRGSGTWMGGGLIRPRDTKMTAGSTWEHALALAYPLTLSSKYVWPATSTDGTCSDANSCIPIGARIQMDPAINCAAWPSLVGEWQRQLCRTLQRYGVIVVDTGSGLTTEQLASVRPYLYPWEGPAGWNALPSDIMPHLRVVDWNKWTGQ
jgi:hypothetical protein